MTTELQNQAWASLPEDFKREVRKMFNNRKGLIPERGMRICTLITLFGEHNLTAEEQPKETKEPNLCELLQGCEGMEFYSPCLGDCIFVRFTKTGRVEITSKSGCVLRLEPNGKINDDCELMLFPSKEVRTWDGWSPYGHLL